MTISAAFNGALSGLQAFGKRSETISSNIANATTPAYARREVILASSTVAPGVGITGVARLDDPVLVAARRTAEAQFAGSDVEATFQADLMRAIGTPDDARSVSARLASFEAALIDAASSPEAPARLERLAYSAIDVATAISDATETLSEARSTADRTIGRQVDRLNALLGDVEGFNQKLVIANARGTETGSLLDQRQRLVDEINTIVPVREIARPNQQIALFSEGGAILIDGKPGEVGFSAVNTVTPYQSLAGGALSGLTLNGQPIGTGASGPLAGGTLAAHFEVRDRLAPKAQDQLDAVARDLIERFQDPVIDPTLGAMDAGLFTDAGSQFDPANALGIANRISVNSQVDPQAGGETWRLRSGLQAATPGPVGDASLLTAMASALDQTRVPASGDFGPGAVTAAGLMSNLSSWAGIEADTADRRLGFLSASFNEIKQMELSGGIDTDAELQNLLLVETAYAANARVLQAVDEMMDVLLGIG